MFSVKKLKFVLFNHSIKQDSIKRAKKGTFSGFLIMGDMYEVPFDGGDGIISEGMTASVPSYEDLQAELERAQRLAQRARCYRKQRDHVYAELVKIQAELEVEKAKNAKLDRKIRAFLT